MGECLNCGKIYKSGAWYSKHVAACKSSASNYSIASNNLNYNNSTSSYNEAKFSCTACGKTYTSRTWYEKHVATCKSSASNHSIASNNLNYNSSASSYNEAKFSCTACGKTYKSRAWYEKHVEACKSSASNHSLTSNNLNFNSSAFSYNEPEFSCTACGKTYKNRVWYERHIASCNSSTFANAFATTSKLPNVNNLDVYNENSFSCKSCGKTYKSRIWYDKHVISCNTNVNQSGNAKFGQAFSNTPQWKSDTTYVCNLCDKTYVSKAWYEKHVIACNSLINLKINDASFKCKECGKTYVSRAWYEKHIAACYGAVQNVCQTSINTSRENNTCGTCGKTHNGNDCHLKHIKTCSDNPTQQQKIEVNFRCKKCSKTYISEAWYEKHIAACYSIALQDHHLSTKISNQNDNSNLARKENHSTMCSPSSSQTQPRNSNLTCAKCGKVYTSAAWYAKHIVACCNRVPNMCHTSKTVTQENNNRNYACVKCGKTYESETWYEKHIAICETILIQKNKQTNYICEKCGKTYFGLPWYEKHISACNIVVQKTRESSTTLNEQIRESKYACNICGKKYKSEVWYNKHIIACNNTLSKQRSNAKYICNICGRSYFSEVWYEKHSISCNGSKKQNMKDTFTNLNPLNKDSQLICQKCGKAYKMIAWYDKHVAACAIVKNVTAKNTSSINTKQQNNIAKLNCQNCGKLFKDKQYYSEHVASCSNLTAQTSLESAMNTNVQQFNEETCQDHAFVSPNTEHLVDDIYGNTDNFNDKMTSNSSSKDSASMKMNQKKSSNPNDLDQLSSTEQLKDQYKRGLILSNNYIELENIVDDMLIKEQKYHKHISQLNERKQQHYNHIENIMKYYKQLIIMLGYGDLNGLKGFIQIENYDFAYCELILNDKDILKAVGQLLAHEECGFINNEVNSNATFNGEDNTSDFTDIMTAINQDSTTLPFVPNTDVINFDFDLESSTDLQKALDEKLDNNSLLASNFLDLEIMIESLTEKEQNYKKVILELCQIVLKFKTYISKLLNCKQKLVKYLHAATKDMLKKYLSVVNIAKENNDDFNMNNENFVFALNDFLVKTETYLYLVEYSV